MSSSMLQKIARSRFEMMKRDASKQTMTTESNGKASLTHTIYLRTHFTDMTWSAFWPVSHQ